MGKKLKRIIAAVICVMMMSASAIFASPMKDVSASHWAYNDITEMQKRGLLLPSSQGEFFPNKYVTFFEFSQILAKATGYQDAGVNPDIDPTLKKAISDNYEKQKPVIGAYEKNYKHWQKDANPEIAYLLGRGYITKEDLGRFMSRSTSGLESKRGVRKQEAALYLVRILHKAETAKDEYVSTGFIDQAKIEVAYRPYVAYMKKLNIVSGNEKGEFGPTQPITRATLSKMLVDTLKIKEAPVVPPTPTPTPTPKEPTLPTDKALEGKFTKMISRGDDGFYLVLEIEPGRTHTYSIDSTASVVDTDGTSISLSTLKSKIDLKGDKDLVVTAHVELQGTTEYITQVKIVTGPTTVVPPVVNKPEIERPEVEKPQIEEVEDYTGQLTGKIHSILMAPKSELTIQNAQGDLRTIGISFDTALYSNLTRKPVALWDLRLSQEVNVNVIKGEVETLEITKPAPPITLTGRIIETSISGDQIKMNVSYNSSSKQVNGKKTINVPMGTQILDGTIERGRNDLRADMEIVVIYGQNEDVIPEQIIILSK